MANGSNRGERLQIMLSGEELTVLDDFRFKKRMPSQPRQFASFSSAGLQLRVSTPRPSVPSPRNLA